MPAFSDVVMHHGKGGRIQADQKVKQRIKNAARVLGRKPVGGFDRNQSYPQKRGDPGLD